MDPEAITIFDESQTEPRTMSDYTSELFFARPSFNDEASLETLQVYAPVNNQSQEEQSISELQEEIRTILRSAGKENN